jgi:SAM-dependent methyltransferase
MEEWIEHLFSEPVINLGDYSRIEFNGIVTPKSSLTNKVDSSIQIYDFDKAKLFDERHYYPEGQRVLINKALGFLPDNPKELILDIGSGSGNSITAALGIFSNAKIMATDISPSLLYIMKKNWMRILPTKDVWGWRVLMYTNSYLKKIHLIWRLVQPFYTI